MSVFQMRYVVTAMVMGSVCVAYITRANLNIAIVSMVDHSLVHKLNSSSSVCPVTVAGAEHRNYELIQIQIYPSPNASKFIERPRKELLLGKRYHWDQSTQAVVLGAFFYTYILFQMPAGVLVEKFGGRWIIVLCLAGSAITSIITPLITDWIWALILSRAFLGAFQSGIFPAGFGILCKWMPLSERSTAFGLLFVGSKIGASLPYFLSGFLVSQYGWPSLFYAPGIFASAVFLLVVLTVKSRPEDDNWISKNELKFITDRKGKESLHRPPNLKIPWRQILWNPAVLSAAFFQFGNFWILTMFYSLLPKYLNEILHMDIKSNGLINGCVSLLSLISLTTTGTLSEIVVQKELLDRTTTRKCFSIISGFATGICILLIPSAGCNRLHLIVTIFMASFFTGFTSGSNTPLPSEMSINFPVTLFSLLNTIQACTGFLTPAFAGAVLQFLTSPRTAWCIVFYFSGSLMILANAVFLVYGSAERQAFDLCVTCSKSFQMTGMKAENGQLEEVPDGGEKSTPAAPDKRQEWALNHWASAASISHVSDEVFR